MSGDSNCFLITFCGQIESACFPAGAGSNSVFVRYELFAGNDWKLISGLDSGISQMSSPGSNLQNICFNFPIEVTYKSTNPSGWPQVIVAVYGINLWGTETILGYGRAHLPIGHFGTNSKSYKIALSVPKCTTTLGSITSWLAARNPEIRETKILIHGQKDHCLHTVSHGYISMVIQSTSQGLSALGFDLGK